MSGDIQKIYITGVAGMIGSNTAKEFLKKGNRVIGVDNLWRGTQKNIEALIDEENFEFRHADIISDQDWFNDMGQDDILIHIADIVAGIGFVFSHEWTVFQKNLLINTSLARVVFSKQPRKLLYLGTACSYPQQMQRSVTESQLRESDKYPADPESGYGWSKLIGEIEFRLATKDIATQCVILDLHNVYGWPCVYADNTSQVIPSLINKALKSEDGNLHVWGNGEQGRAFLHVSDVVSAIVKAISHDGEDFSTFMIGPSTCTTIREIAEIIISHPRVGASKIVYDTSKPTGDIGRYADSTLAQAELGWQPEMDLRHGLYSLIEAIIDDLE